MGSNSPNRSKRYDGLRANGGGIIPGRRGNQYVSINQYFTVQAANRVRWIYPLPPFRWWRRIFCERYSSAERVGGSARRCGAAAGLRPSVVGWAGCDVNADSDYGGRADPHSHKRVELIVVQLRVVCSIMLVQWYFYTSTVFISSYRPI